jgi:Lrp/AsnC family transcriptional regulator for asnA, asnC and gidA
MKENYQIDKLDKEILSVLMEDARTPYTDIAKKLIVSPGTIHVRMRKLEELGVVKKSVLEIEPANLGYDLCAFLGVHLDHGSVYRSVLEEIRKIPEVVESYYTTGNYGIFLKIYCKNTQHLYDLLNVRIHQIEGVRGTETLISLENAIHRQIRLE